MLQPLLTSHSGSPQGLGPLPGFLKLCPLESNFLGFMSGIKIRDSFFSTSFL